MYVNVTLLDFSEQYIMNVDKEIFGAYAVYAAIVIMKMLIISIGQKFKSGVLASFKEVEQEEVGL